MADLKGTLIEYHDGSKVILEFNPKKHWYSIDGEYVPACTTILNNIAKPALIPWAANEGAKFYVQNYQLLGRHPPSSMRTWLRVYVMPLGLPLGQLSM